MFTVKLFEMLGVKGLFIIALLLVIGTEAATISIYKTKVESLNTTILEKETKIVKLNAQLDLQDEAISKFEEQAKNTGALITDAQKRINELDSKNKSFKKQLEQMPLAINCVGAMTELKSQTSIMIKDWNKK